MEYEACWELQRRLAADFSGDTLLFVEHPPVLTLGSSFHPENLLNSVESYSERGIQVVRTDRGGDVTFHGPKQLVIYPIFDLSARGKDLHKWLRDLEEVVIIALSKFGLAGRRFPPHTGVWIGDKKIAAIGIKVSKWISMHGIALNCNNDLSPFDLIVPCGIKGYQVTSISADVGYEVTPDNAREKILEAFSELFECEFLKMDREAVA